MVNQYSTVLKTSLQAGIDRMKEACFAALAPIFEALEEKVEKFIMMRVHDEDWENNSDPLPGGSKCVSSLTTALKLFQENYLNGLISGHFAVLLAESRLLAVIKPPRQEEMVVFKAYRRQALVLYFEKCGGTFENIIDSFVRNAPLLFKNFPFPGVID